MTKEWSASVEAVLLEQQKNCAVYKWIHERDSSILQKRNTYISITTIIIVSLSATVSTFTANISPSDNLYYLTVVRIINSVILYISAVLSALQQFLKYEKEAEKHKATSTKYTALYNNIKRMLSLDPSERQNVANYFTWVNKEYDSILNGSPDVLSGSVEEFYKIFGVNFTEETGEDIKVNINNMEDIIEGNDEEVSEIQNETNRLRYELERYVQNSYS